VSINIEVFFILLRWNLVRQWNVPACSETANVGTVLVLDSEQCPHPTTADLRQTSNECKECRMLEFIVKYGIEDPVEP